MLVRGGRVDWRSLVPDGRGVGAEDPCLEVGGETLFSAERVEV